MECNLKEEKQALACERSLCIGTKSLLVYNINMYELIKNIGLGLFVNGTYSILNANINIHNIAITIGSIFIMWLAIILDKGKGK